MPHALQPFDVATPKPRLLDRVRRKIRLTHCSIRTEKPYVEWVHRCLPFHRPRHPETLGAQAVETFLTDLAAGGNVAGATPNQATWAVLFRAFWGRNHATFSSRERRFADLGSRRS